MSQHHDIRSLLLVAVLVLMGMTACIKKDVPAPLPTGAMQTLKSTLQNNYSFSLFYYALQKTGLDQLLSDTSIAYTLLVPDNDAFARDSIFGDSDLNKLDTAYLRQWISYHIVVGAVTSTAIPQSLNNPFPNISGQTLYFSRPVPGNGQAQPAPALHINGDTVNQLDQTASDGVIQVLNRPLKLPAVSVQAYLQAHAQYSMLVTALQRFGLWDSLTMAGPYTIWAPDNDAFAASGISSDSLNNIDTAHFQLSLFRIYVLSPARVFLSDFSDVPPTSVLLAPNNGPYNVESPATSGVPQTEFEVTDINGFGITVPWTDPDNIAGNGVVQGIGDLLLRPDQAAK